MKKRILAIMLSLCMVLTLFPATAFAAEEDLAVASVGNDKFFSLQDAINAAGETGATVKLLSDVELLDQSLTIAKDQDVVLDTNGKTLSGVATSAAASNLIKVESGASLEIIGKGKVSFRATTPDTDWGENSSNAYPGYANNTISNRGNLTINDATVENWTAKGGASYVIDNYDGGVVVVEKGNVIQQGNDVAIRQFASSATAANSVTINGGVIKGVRAVWMQLAGSDSKVAPDANLTVTGGDLYCAADRSGYELSVYVYSYGNSRANVNVDISGGTFYGDVAFTGGQTKDPVETVSITGGNFKDVYSYGEMGGVIEGGYFKADPTDYLAEGLVAVSSDKAGYKYTVAEKAELEVDTAVQAGEPTVNVPSDVGITEDELKEAIAAPATQNDLKAAASGLANDEKVITDEVIEEAVEKLGTADTTEITVVVEPYLDIEVKSVETVDGTKIMTLEITPMYNLVATTGEGVDTKTEVIKEAQEMDVVSPVEITVPLPAGFVVDNEPVFVKHIKDKGNTYIYKATVENGKATFTNPNGFSKFELTAETPVAQIGDTYYETLQAAVDAVKDGETIILNQNCDEDVIVSRTVEFILEKADANVYTGEIKGGANTEVTVEGDTYTCVYTAPAGGGAVDEEYTITIADTENGIVTCEKEVATEGDLVDFKVTPAEGYEIADVMIRDENDEDTGMMYDDEGNYTFEMPASDVTITVTFSEIVVIENPFVDVNENDYFYAPVLWAVGNDITTGITDTTFCPKMACTRAQALTFIWRSAGCPEPETTVNPFTDVKADAYYYDAVLWAVENGITTGVTDTTFKPHDTVTRAQSITFLYRFGGGTNVEDCVFTDVPANAYYREAVVWATEMGITTGITETTFGPNLNCDRGQMVTFLYRLFDEAVY